MTAGALALLDAAVGTPTTAVATLVVGAANAVSTVVRFVAMRSWIFRRPPARAQDPVTMDEPPPSSSTTDPVRSNPSTEPWHTVTSP